jgi:hypothetical protein
VVLTNTVAICYFIDFLGPVGGQNYIDCFLAIEVKVDAKMVVRNSIRKMEKIVHLYFM